MAIQHVPTIAMRVDDNPKGSATRHVTMRADNPFERQAPVVRAANQRDMLPGMGLGELGFEATDWTSSTSALPIGPQQAAPTTTAVSSGGWGDIFGGLTQSITGALVDVGAAYATSELVDKKVDTGPSSQDLMTMFAMQQMGAPQAAPLPAPQPQYLPYPQPQPMPVVAPSYPPAPPKSNAMLWVVGGVAAVALLGGGLLAAKKRK